MLGPIFMARFKKQARRRSYGRRRSTKRYSRKSMFRLVKGFVYAGAIAVPAYQIYQVHKGKPAGEIASKILSQYAFMNSDTGAFSGAAGLSVWGPVATVAIVDFATTKLPIQSAISRGLRNIF